MNEQELKDHISRKYEAWLFFRSLRKVMPCEKKIASLEAEINRAKEELEAIKKSEKVIKKLSELSMTDTPLRKFNRMYE